MGRAEHPRLAILLALLVIGCSSVTAKSTLTPCMGPWMKPATALEKDACLGTGGQWVIDNKLGSKDMCMNWPAGNNRYWIPGTLCETRMDYNRTSTFGWKLVTYTKARCTTPADYNDLHESMDATVLPWYLITPSDAAAGYFDRMRAVPITDLWIPCKEYATDGQVEVAVWTPKFGEFRIQGCPVPLTNKTDEYRIPCMELGKVVTHDLYTGNPNGCWTIGNGLWSAWRPTKFWGCMEYSNDLSDNPSYDVSSSPDSKIADCHSRPGAYEGSECNAQVVKQDGALYRYRSIYSKFMACCDDPIFRTSSQCEAMCSSSEYTMNGSPYPITTTAAPTTTTTPTTTSTESTTSHFTNPPWNSTTTSTVTSTTTTLATTTAIEYKSRQCLIPRRITSAVTMESCLSPGNQWCSTGTYKGCGEIGSKHYACPGECVRGDKPVNNGFELGYMEGKAIYQGEYMTRITWLSQGDGITHRYWLANQASNQIVGGSGRVETFSEYIPPMTTTTRTTVSSTTVTSSVDTTTQTRSTQRTTTRVTTPRPTKLPPSSSSTMDSSWALPLCLAVATRSPWVAMAGMMASVRLTQAQSTSTIASSTTTKPTSVASSTTTVVTSTTTTPTTTTTTTTPTTTTTTPTTTPTTTAIPTTTTTPTTTTPTTTLTTTEPPPSTTTLTTSTTTRTHIPPRKLSKAALGVVSAKIGYTAGNITVTKSAFTDFCCVGTACTPTSLGNNSWVDLDNCVQLAEPIDGVWTSVSGFAMPSPNIVELNRIGTYGCSDYTCVMSLEGDSTQIGIVEGYSNVDLAFLNPRSELTGGMRFWDGEAGIRRTAAPKLSVMYKEEPREVKYKYNFKSTSCSRHGLNGVGVMMGEPTTPYEKAYSFCIRNSSNLCETAIAFPLFPAGIGEKTKTCQCPPRSVCDLVNGTLVAYSTQGQIDGMAAIGGVPVTVFKMISLEDQYGGFPISKFKDPLVFTEFGLLELWWPSSKVYESLGDGRPRTGTIILNKFVTSVAEIIPRKGALVLSSGSVSSSRMQVSAFGIGIQEPDQREENITISRTTHYVGLAGQYRSTDYCQVTFSGSGRMSRAARLSCRAYDKATTGWWIGGSVFFLFGLPWIWSLVWVLLSKTKWKFARHMVDHRCMNILQVICDRVLTQDQRVQLKEKLFRNNGEFQTGGPKMRNYKDELCRAIHQHRYYKGVLFCAKWITPVWYGLILLGWALVPIMAVLALVSMVKKPRTMEKFKAVCLVPLVIYQIPASMAFVDPSVREVGITVSLTSSCNGDDCVGSFLQAFPMLQVEGYQVSSKVVDSAGTEVGSVGITVSKVNISFLGIYDYSIYSVPSTTDIWHIDANDDCDKDSDYWDCNNFSGQRAIWCLLYENEFEEGDSSQVGGWSHLIDRAHSVFTPGTVGFRCPKDVWAGTAPADGQRYRIRWFPQGSTSPVVRVFEMPRASLQLELEVSVTIGDSTRKETVVVDDLGTTGDIGEYTRVSATSWESGYNLEGKRVGCIYDTPTSATPSLCLGDFEGYSTTGNFLKCRGEMWGPGAPTGGYLPDTCNIPEETYSWGNWGATISTRWQMLWNQKDVAGLGSSLPSLTGCGYYAYTVAGTETINNTKKCSNTDYTNSQDCGGNNWQWLDVTQYMPNRLALELNSCSYKKLEVTMATTDFPYILSGADVVRADPNKMTFTVTGCYDFIDRGTMRVSKESGAEGGVLILRDGTVLVPGAVVVQDDPVEVGVTLLQGEDLYFEAMSQDGKSYITIKSAMVAEACEGYSDEEGGEPEDNSPNTAGLTWWEILLIVLASVVLFILLVGMCFCCARSGLYDGISRKVTVAVKKAKPSGSWLERSKSAKTD